MPALKDLSSVPAKLSAPHGNRPVLRDRLFRRLDELCRAPTVWLAGPPGCGKTTLIGSYLAERGANGLWIQLDADDADIPTFFHFLGLAVEHAADRAAPPLPKLLPQYLPRPMAYARRFMQALVDRLGQPTAIVLDNYEQVPAEAPLHEVVRELASSLPQGVTLFVLSRTEPPPACARLRLHESLALLEGPELDLTRDEGLALLAARESRQPTEADGVRVERLLAETGGWLAGYTLLLGESRRQHSPQRAATTRQLLFDYFAAELFGHFDPAMQQALIRTALLPTMTAAAAAQISGHPAVGDMLARLHRRNCFVAQRGPLEPVYEYHALFRAFLLSEAAGSIGAAEWRALQRQAADLLAATGQAEAAAGLYRAAGHGPGLAALALREAPALIASGRHRTLDHWLCDLPPPLLDASAWLTYWQAMARLPFDAVAARGIFERAYAGFAREDDAVGLYSAWAGVMESYFFEWRDFRPADPWIAEFEHLRARHPAFPSRAIELRTYWAMGTLLHRQPQHPMLPAWAERGQALLGPVDRDLSVLLGGYLIIWFLWRGECGRARTVIDRVTPWIDPEMSPMVQILWSCAAGLFHSARGETEDCRTHVESGLGLARRTGLHTFDFLLSAQMARCCLIAGDAAGAEPWIAGMADTMHSHSHVDGAFYQHLHANAAAQRGARQLAIDHARGALAMAHESGVPFMVAHCHLDLARALLGRDDDATGAEHLQAAREIGRSMGSRVVEHLCLEVEALAAIQRGDDAAVEALLTRALALGRVLDGAAYHVSGPQVCVPLYERALSSGLEVDHVQALIRRHRLSPSDPAIVAESWPWPVRVYTLGRFEILCDGQPLQPSRKPQHKPLELLKCLCAFGGQAVAQDRVTDALWPDTEGDAADQALRTTLHRLRKLLRHDQAVRLEDRHLHLDTRVLWADCLAFDRAAQRASHRPGAADVPSLQQALARYRGPFLHGESASWAMARRHHLSARFMSMAEQLGDLLERRDEWSAAIDCYRHALDLEPLAEGFHRRLMTTYARLGRRSEALTAYQRCRQALLSGLGVSPAEQTQELYRRLMAS